MKNRYTMQDIASRLGITKMTVSRYLKDPSKVAESTGSRIAAAIEELGYIPNRAPAMLAKSSSQAIGLVIPSFSNMVFSDLIRGVSEKASQAGYSVLITHMGYNMEEEEKQVASLLSYQMDALILTEPRHSPLTVKRIKDTHLPTVEVMSLPYRPLDMAIGLDHEAIAYQAVKALIACGRRQIVYLSVRLDTRNMIRQEGYSRAMNEAGLVPKVYSSPERSTFTLAGKLMREALDDCPQLDAILCTNDDVAVGAMLYCQSVGVKIPEDIAILGYNGLNIGDATIPRLCSIATPRYEMGSMAMDLILKRLAGEKITRRKIKLHHTVTNGATVTPAELKALLATVPDGRPSPAHRGDY